MISAGKIQNRCPGCRAQVLGFYDALLQPRSGATSRPFLRSSARSPAVATSTALTVHPRAGPVRQFSSTRRVFLQDSTPNKPPTQSHDEHIDSEILDDLEDVVEDAETVVRQARQTFGHTLPTGYLTEEEYKLYERLYGPPLRETRPEDVGIPEQARNEEAEALASTPRNVLLRENEHGHYEEVEYTIEPGTDGVEDEAAVEGIPTDIDTAEDLVPLTESQLDYLNITANNQREYDALVKLQKDFEVASLQPFEDINEEDMIEEEEPFEEEEEEEDDGEPGATFVEEWDPSEPRLHPNTIIGQSGTFPSTVHLPKVNFVQPITTLLRRTDHSHVREAAEKVFGGSGLPQSPFTPKRKQGVAMKAIGLQASHHRMSEIDADTFLTAVMPPVYASVMSTLVEVRKRLGSDWLRGLFTRADGTGPRILDSGGGGAGLLAWEEVLQAEWDILREKGEVTGPQPIGRKTVLVGSDHLRHRISTFLDDTTFIPRLPDYVHSGNTQRLLYGSQVPAPRKVFDVIIVSHMLMALESDHKRKAILDNIWEMLSPEGGVLIVLEKGHPRGFEAVADLRDRVLNEFIIPPTPQPHPEEIQPKTERVREPGMIIAPCTNHHKCPMYLVPGLSNGRKDFCHFSQRFIRPPFLQKLFGATNRNHDDVDFSYVAVQRGVHPSGSASSVAPDSSPVADSASSPQYLTGKEAADRAFAGYESADGPAPHPLSLPRNVLPPLKRHGHVTFDLCTPIGTIERWTVPKSFSKQAYHDARKAQWGDLWALGAKTRTHRAIRLGKAAAAAAANGELTPNLTDGGVRARAQAAAGRGSKSRVLEFDLDRRPGMATGKERFPGNRAPVERRTKGGRKPNIRDLVKELDEAEKKGKKRRSEEDFDVSEERL
ncbi:mitochondrial small ribosomal subunit Rsm22-domain-containing protein [Apodospora peruviana]|uniref:Mitochondrial small ribosomal subunit Rsm22-domain-containing protein n=1 Tax=Apodospora peruviana TaxID=516989 RepID=A0AAE0IU65_9PEZI|nr:mitochondrial small ribosomal subunit Rsm22-domain-containing protein [Apodospora peruviana]